MTPLIPRDILFGNPERISPQLSPDGQFLAYIAPNDQNVLQVWVRTMSKTDDRVLTADRARGIRSFFWSYTSRQILYMQDMEGDENFHIYSVDLDGEIVRDLTPFQGVQARLVARDPKRPGEILVEMNIRDRRHHDVYRVTLATGAVDLDTENPGTVISWAADGDMQVRACTASTPDGGFDLSIRDNRNAPWHLVRHWEAGDQGGPLAFSKDGKTLYLVGTHDANAQRLIALDCASLKETVIAEDSAYDVGGALLHPTERTIQAVSFYRDKLEWELLDDSLRPDFERIAALRPKPFTIDHRTLKDDRWLVSFSNDDGPVYYYVYDRPTHQATLLFSHQPKLEGLPLRPMQPIVFNARDGLALHGYLTVPERTAQERLPTVLLVHGGPWARDHWGFHRIVQWLANRGYAVLQINFRGSTGYGKAFLEAGNREWAAKMHTDLLDGKEWIIQQGIADPKRVAIMGGSYGGYATLVGLTFTPDVFAAGVDIVGPSNLLTLIATIPPYWAPMRAMFKRRVGDFETDEAFLKSRSPLYFVDQIQAPLLIGQGANDPRVKQSESEQIVQAMRKAGKPVEYLLYTDEGHGFVRPANNMHFFARAEAFLAKHLGGRAEPVGEITGHSAVEK